MLAYRRRSEDDERIVIVNYTDEVVAVPVEGGRTVDVASDGRDEGGGYGGAVGPSAAVILR